MSDISGKKNHNVIIILLDGSRIDMLDEVPNLKSLREDGTFFEQSVISSPYTVASIHSFFTGMQGSKNGVNSYYNMFGLNKNVKTMAQYFKENEYYTHGDIMNEAVISPLGFDELNVHDEHNVEMLPHHKSIIETASTKKQNFFLFLQYSKIHTDSIINVAKKFDDLDPEYFTEKQKKINRKRYLKSLFDAGDYKKEIMKYLEDMDLLDDTIIVFFSDHGTSIGEKFGEKMYGSFTYDYTILSYVCFINKKIFPVQKIDYQIRMIDVMPTILEAVSIIPDNHCTKMEGLSLFPFFRRTKKPGFFTKSRLEANDRIAYVETGGLNGPWPSPERPNVKCLRTPFFKVIHNLTPDTWEFYDLKADPGEKTNLIEKNIKEKASMIKSLTEIEKEQIS